MNPNNYNIGVFLYSQIPSLNPKLLYTFSRRKCSYNEEKLRKSLEDYIGVKIQEKDQVEVLSKKVIKSVRSRYSIITAEFLEKILHQRKLFYSQRDAWRAQLHNVLSNKDRYELAKNIIEIQPKIDILNSQVAYIKTYKSIPETLKSYDYKKYNNIRVYIHRYKKALLDKKLTTKQSEKYNKKLSEYEMDYKKMKINYNDS